MTAVDAQPWLKKAKRIATHTAFLSGPIMTNQMSWSMVAWVDQKPSSRLCRQGDPSQPQRRHGPGSAAQHTQGKLSQAVWAHHI